MLNIFDIKIYFDKSMSEKLEIFVRNKEKNSNLLKKIFLLHNKNSHFVKAEPLDKNFFFKKSFSIFKGISPKKEKKNLSMMNKKG